MTYRSAYSERDYRPDDSYSQTGDAYRWTYKYIINADGQRELIKDQQTDIIAEIDSYREETDIKNIVKRASYDPSVWDAFGMDMREGYRDEPDYDITMAPGSLAEAQNIILTAKQTFHDLPPEVRHKFGDSAEAFIRSYGSSEWLLAMGLTPDSTAKRYPGSETVEEQERKKGMRDEQE